jgi:hypothetical protein
MVQSHGPKRMVGSEIFGELLILKQRLGQLAITNLDKSRVG